MNEDEYKIEKNVEIPSKRSSEFGSALSKMIPGDSLFVSTRNKAVYGCSVLGRNGFKWIRRKEGNGYRIWCIEK